MDNADKVKKSLTHKEVALFLGEDLKQQIAEAVSTYSLADEYAKTKKNHRPLVWLLLAVCFFVVGAGTFTTIGLLVNSNHKIAINIDSFDDLNLRTLLSSVGRLNSLYEMAVKKKSTLEDSLGHELALASQKRENDLFTLSSVQSVASAEAVASRKAGIELNYNTAVKNLHDSYDSLISEAAAEIEKYRSLIGSYDSKEVSKAKDSESVVDSTKQLHDLEMKMQEERYEKRIKELKMQLISQQAQAAEEQKKAVEDVRNIYQAKINMLDPNAREENEEQDKILKDTGIENPSTVSFLWNSVNTLTFKESAYTSGFSNPDLNFVNALKNTEKNLSQLEVIASRFQLIPMQNSIKDYVPAMIHQSYKIANEMAETGTKMQENIDWLKEEIAVRDSFLESLIDSKTCDGIIISSSDSPVIHAYISEKARSLIQPAQAVPVQVLNGNKAAGEMLLFYDGTDYTLTQKPADENTSGKKHAVPYQAKTGDRIRLSL